MATVDILMAAYNGERYIREQIESIQSQSFADWRLLISDNCSSDGTLDIVHAITSKDSRIKVVSEGVRYGSAKANFMGLLAKATAPYVMFCNQDDVWFLNKVELSLDRMEELEDVEGPDKPHMVFTDMKVVNSGLGIVHESFEKFSHIDSSRTSFSWLLEHAVGVGCAMMVNRRAVELASMAENIESVATYDWWLSLVCSAFGSITYIDSPTSLYRQHEDNEVGTKSCSSLKRPPCSEGMSGSVVASTVQAVAFQATYDDMLEKEQRGVLAEFVSANKSDGSNAIWCHTNSGCWKNGLCKSGRAAVTISGRRVVAVVVTYNPNPERLKENLSAISRQVDAVLLYDNASDDTASIETIAVTACDYYYLGDLNVGLARALNKALAKALNLGAEHVLLLDQDSIAGEGMVAGLVEQRRGDVALVSPQIVDRNKCEGFIPGEASVQIKRAITSGALVSLQAWQNVGGFDERLFVDWVDYEFSANLRAHGYRILRNNQVMLLHEMGHREYVFTLPLPSGGIPFYRTNHSLLRQRDKARSWAIVKRKYGWSKIGREERVYMDAIKVRDLILERNRLSIISAFLKGGKEGREAV